MTSAWPGTCQFNVYKYIKQHDPACTVEAVLKGHFDDRTPSDQGTLSQNHVLSSPYIHVVGMSSKL